MKKKIIILQTGQSIKQARKKYGDFDELFIKGLGIASSQTKVIHVYNNENFPNYEEIAGIIITGSPAMVTEGHSWCQKTQQWLKQFVNSSLPILGVCYGHQLLAKVLGGSVQWNSNGREIGQVEVLLTEDAYNDKLFADLVNCSNSPIKLQATHQQAVTYLPEKVKILGQTQLDAHHCFCYNNHIWGMQFHPEFTPEIIKDYIKLRYDEVKKEGLNPDQLIAEVEDVNNGATLLQKFAEMCFQYRN